MGLQFLKRGIRLWHLWPDQSCLPLASRGRRQLKGIKFIDHSIFPPKPAVNPRPQTLWPKPHELESKFLKGGHIGGSIGDDHYIIKGDTRSQDYGSRGPPQAEA